MTTKTSLSNFLKKQLPRKEFSLLLIFAVIFTIISILSPRRFLSLYNLQSMAYQLPEFGLLALSMMIIIITGGINLSITFTATLSMIVGGYAMSAMFSGGTAAGLSVLVGILLMLAVSGICGILNGYVVAYIGVTPMLATLGSMTLFEGLGLQITKGGAVSGFPAEFLKVGNSAILGIPIPMLLFITIAVFTYFLLERSKMGMRLYMIGSSPKVCYFSGINVKRNLFMAYILASFFAGIAGIFMASRYNSAKESYGSSYLLQAVSAAVLGGASIYGGEGKVVGTVIAVMIIQIMSSGLNIIGLNRYLTNVVMGLILIIVLTINYLSSKRKQGTKIRTNKPKEENR